MADYVMITYFISLTILFFFGSSGFVMIYYYLKHRNKVEEKLPELKEFPIVTIQLPLYNEQYVAERVIEATCNIAYLPENLEIQVLDDSTDETVQVVTAIVEKYRAKGFDIKHIHRTNRQGYKA